MLGIELVALNKPHKLRLEKVLEELESLSAKLNSNTSVTIADSIAVNHDDAILKGHGTIDFNGEVIATLCGGINPRLEISIVTDGSREFAEYTTLRLWVRQWLNYVKWYYMVAVCPGVTIQDLLDTPFVNQKWQVESIDSQLVRFGLM